MDPKLQNDPEFMQLLSRCSYDTRFLAKTLFAETCSRPFHQVTDKIFDAIDDPTHQQIVIAAFRSFGKTTIINKMLPSRHILFRSKKFIVPISATATLAQQMGENLKSELRSNSEVKKIFGDIKTDATTFSKEMFIAMDTLVMPRGAGQQIRGVLHTRHRPDLIIGDDLEDPELSKNPENRKNLKRWFRSDVMNSIDRSRDDWKIIVVGTVVHEDSLLVDLLNDPDWFHIDLPLCNETYNSFHPGYLSSEKVKELAEQFAARGELDIFFMEYMNSIRPKDAPFSKELFKYYVEDGSMTFDKTVDNIVLADPAKTTQMKSAFSAIMSIGINLANHVHDYKSIISERRQGIYVRDIVNDRFHPEEFFEAAYQMCKRTGARVIGVEITGLDEYITYPMETYFAQRGFYPEFIWLRSPSGRDNINAKTKRVKGLSPWYRQGLIWHNPHVTTVLETQLLSFPRSKFWDVMDVFGYIVQMLDENELGFPEEPDAAERYATDVDKELAELYKYDNEDVDWRII